MFVIFSFSIHPKFVNHFILKANVGCSSGCRCDGCKNVYGRKGGKALNQEIVFPHPCDNICSFTRCTMDNKLVVLWVTKNIPFIFIEL